MALALAQDVGASLSLRTLASMRVERSEWPGMLDGAMVALLTGATKWVADVQPDPSQVRPVMVGF